MELFDSSPVGTLQNGLEHYLCRSQ
jgi:hypothetical protein